MSTTDNSRVRGSSPVRGMFLLNLFFSTTILADLADNIWRNIILKSSS